jgi:hypothetical protein
MREEMVAMIIGPRPSLTECQCLLRVRSQCDTYKHDNARPVSINLTVLSEPRGWLMRTSAPGGWRHRVHRTTYEAVTGEQLSGEILLG